MTPTTLRHRRTLTATLLSLSIILGLAPRATFAARASRTAPPAPHTDVRSPKQSVKTSSARMPSFFEENVGQAGAGTRFVSRGAGHTLLLDAEGVTLALKKGGVEEGSGAMGGRRVSGERARGQRTPEPASFQIVRLRFDGANPRPRIEGVGALAGKINYFVGRDPSKWRTGVRAYTSVLYHDLYPGVDLVFHGGDGGGRLEYDFVLAPGADCRKVRLSFEGADGLSLGKDGELLLRAGAGTVSQSAPFIYQDVDGERRRVEGGFVLRGRREVGFRVGAYDRGRALVIDPVLAYSTYFFGASDMAVDAAGAVYVVGTSQGFGVELPTTPGAFQPTRRGVTDAFIAKLDPTGSALSYLTYLGGSDPALSFDGSNDYGNGIAVDAAGNAYVTGLTETSDFPVTPGAFQPARGGNVDGFVTKLNPTGSALVYSSRLGGRDSEWGNGIAVDAAGNAYVVGSTSSNDFPIRNALQPSRKGFEDLFLTKVAPDGRSLDYSTYLGGTEYEPGYNTHVAVDSAGAAYLAAYTYSRDYPTTNGAFQPAPGSPAGSFMPDAVVTKVAPGGQSLVYSTYLGGSHNETAYDIAVDAAGQAHVVGLTDSEDFPTLNALHPTARDPRGNGFLTKLNAAGTALVYSTYLSGTPSDACLGQLISEVIGCGGEYATGVATDAAGNAYVTGNTVSTDFPISPDTPQPGPNGPSDAYVIKLDPAGQTLYSTRLGGSSYDDGARIHVGDAGQVYLLGYTSSDDFPTVNAYHGAQPQGFDITYGSFVMKLSETEVAGQMGRVFFDSPIYTVGEAEGLLHLLVRRSGDLSQAVSVEYSTGTDGTASESSDFTTARGTLRFAPGETSKDLSVSVTDDRTVEGEESFNVSLHNLRGGAALDTPTTTRVNILDDDLHPGTSNPIDDTAFFVRQHYLDFLGREPDPSGLAFWTNEIEQCGTDATCREMKRINVSAAFFLSIEFQETGFLVERFHRLAFEESVFYRSFIGETRQLGEGVIVGQGEWRQRLDANRRAYAEAFTARVDFRAQFPESLTAAQYVERLNERASGALSQTEFAALVNGLEAGTETRGSVLLKVADDQDYRRREFAPAFVLMQYLGYLRRAADFEGYDFWLAKLNQFGGDFVRAEMVKAFLNSDEYRRRFREPQREATFGTPFTLGYREQAVLLPDSLRVTLLDVGFDSRCPRGSQCPTPGSISILFEVTKPGGASAHFILSLPGGAPRPYPGNTPLQAFGYTFRLLQADPEPPYPNPTTPFNALLQVDRN